ncbi:hypothetical protein [Desulfovibrio sp.]|uniref:hypothetical protein n=1 Tax=Desulfovibrio sp. TaxID=885 RepID=UPI0023D4E4F1|nr:hypothetical protein [Desulfovibrio sp.]MDE7242029.1 hypothetical protein [Desulfovibrio sp.]
MPALTFSKWSSGGNTTIFLHDADARPGRQAAFARAVLSPDILGAEQAGTVSLARRSLTMAGGEFCVNASRAFGALLALSAPARGEMRQEVRVSGWRGPVALTVRGAAPRWQVAARLTLAPETGPERIPGLPAGARLVRLPGISHLLLPLEDAQLPQDLTGSARALLGQAHLLGEAAAGVIWWRPHETGFAMTPVVHVRDARSLVAENACGSGALALALELSARHGLRECRLTQPSGSLLQVRVGEPGADGRVMADIDGPVTLIARGRVWLDAADAEN